MKILEFNDFILESERIDEGIIDDWNDKKFLIEIKAYLSRYYNKTFLKNLSKSNKEKLEKINDLYNKYMDGKKEVKADLFIVAKDLLDKRKSAIKYTTDTNIKTSNFG